jgi:hypothetical protein
MQFLTTKQSQGVASSIPTSVTAKKNQKNGIVPNVKFLGVPPENLHSIADVAQRQSVSGLGWVRQAGRKRERLQNHLHGGR